MFQMHKFLDPTVCSEANVSQNVRLRSMENYKRNFAHLKGYIIDVFRAVQNSDPRAWIFLPYNVQYDIQTLNHIIF